MSLKAKGLLSLMLSLPDNWDYSAAGLVTLSKDGKDSVNAALKELEQFGYLKRTQAFNENGTFGGYDYEIYEQPTSVNFENPSTEKPFTENPTQLNTNKKNKKELSIKEEEERKKENGRTTYDAIINGKIFDKDVKKALYEFIKMRKMTKRPLTDFALEKIIEKLFKISYDPTVQIEVLENSILNNYPDIYKPKQGKKTKTVVPAVKEQIDEEIDEDDKLDYCFETLLLSENQIGSLLNLMGLDMFHVYVDKMKEFIKENGNVIKSHYATMVKWYKEDTKVAM